MRRTHASTAIVVAGVLAAAALWWLPIPADTNVTPTPDCRTLSEGEFGLGTSGCESNTSLRSGQLIEVIAVTVIAGTSIGRKRLGRRIGAALLVLVALVAIINGVSVAVSPEPFARVSAVPDLAFSVICAWGVVALLKRRDSGKD